MIHELARVFDHAWWWFLHASGADNPSGVEYGFWSGFGSDVTEFALLGGLVHVVHQHNCQVRGCWRLGLHPTAAGHKACRKHHPVLGRRERLTVADMHAAHHRARIDRQ